MAQSVVMNKSGAAFIVSNDYDCAPKFDMLKGLTKTLKEWLKCLLNWDTKLLRVKT